MTTPIFTLIPDPRDPFEAPGMTEAELVRRVTEFIDSLNRGITVVVTAGVAA